MEISTLRDKVHRLVDESNEELLQSVFQLLQESEYTEEFKNILDEEFADYKKNKNVSVNAFFGKLPHLEDGLKTQKRLRG